MRVFVLPSWFPPNGGSFFLEQSLILNEVSDQIVLFIEPVSIKKVIARSFNISNLYKIREDNIGGMSIIRLQYIVVPKTSTLNMAIQNRLYEIIFSYAVKKFGKPDLVHVHSCIWGGKYALNILKKHNVPYIITEHRGRFVDNYFARKANQLPKKYNAILKDVLSSSSFIIPVSKAMNRKIMEYTQTSTVKNIPNVFNEDLFYYDNINKFSKFTFICVAGLVELKSIDVLLKSFAMLNTYDKSCQLKIIGSGEKYQELHNLSHALNINDKVDFLGQQDRVKVAELMKKSHVFVLPTKYEAFGVVLIEALAVGIPIISTKNSGGPSEIVNSQNGILVEIDNINDLCSAMSDLKKNYSKYNKNKIADEALKKYGKKTFKESYYEIYQQFI